MEDLSCFCLVRFPFEYWYMGLHRESDFITYLNVGLRVEYGVGLDVTGVAVG